MSLKAKDNHNSYAIGYGRPPQHSRFKKGQSGNPTGRRRYTESERGRQLLLQEANRLVTVRDGAKTLRISAFQAALRSLFISAAKGNPSAQKTMLNAVRAIEKTDGDNNPAGIVISWQEPEPMTATPANLLEQLDLSHFTDEELDRFEELLSKALKKDNLESK
jgi:Family of unknown function (DUF5681)